MKIIINSVIAGYHEFLSDYSTDIEINVVDTVEELFNSTGIVLLTHNLLNLNLSKVYSNRQNQYILYMPTEGTNTIENFFNRDLQWDDNYKRPFIISSGDFGNNDHVNIDAFRIVLGRTTNHLKYLNSRTFENIFNKQHKPFAFNFLNGVNRSHRSKLINLLEQKNILRLGLWTALYNNIFLPDNYKFEFEKNNFKEGMYIKEGWPAGIIHSPIYEDTYFSIVTETNYEMPYSYRTEKIYKPLKIGHPFIAVSNYGFYRDLHNLGFKTFGNLIDESFDLIENNNDRLNRIADIIDNLVKSNLVDFLLAAKDICLHNRNLMLDTIDSGHNINLLNQFTEKFNQYAQKE